MIRHPDSNLQIAEKIELALSSQNKRVNTEGTNIVTNEFNREDYVINKAQTAEKFESHELSLQSLQESKQNVLTAGNGININNNSVISVVWDWIKTKISSVFGLTADNYSGKAATAETADKTAAAITFSDTGEGAESGSTFDGSAARTLSYNSIGAQKALTPVQLDAVNSGVSSELIMPKATYSVNKDGTAHHINFSGTFALTRANIKSFFAVFPETILSRSATYWPRERGSSYNNWGVIDDELLPSDRNINLPFGIYLVTPVAVDNYYVYRKIYSLDYLLGKILS